MNKEFYRMQMLAGIITENQYKHRKQLNESITSDEFEEIIDRYEEEVTEESDDFDDIGRMVSERAEMEIQKEYPNITVDYSPAMDSQQNQKRLYSAYDKEEEETVAEYYFEP